MFHVSHSTYFYQYWEYHWVTDRLRRSEWKNKFGQGAGRGVPHKHQIRPNGKIQRQDAENRNMDLFNWYKLHQVRVCETRGNNSKTGE